MGVEKLGFASDARKKALKLYKEAAQGFMEIDDLAQAGLAYEGAAILERDFHKEEWDAYRSIRQRLNQECLTHTSDIQCSKHG